MVWWLQMLCTVPKAMDVNGEKNPPWQRVASCFVQRSPLLIPKNLKEEFCVWCFQNQQEELGVWYSQESGACVPHSINKNLAHLHLPSIRFTKFIPHARFLQPPYIKKPLSHSPYKKFYHFLFCPKTWLESLSKTQLNILKKKKNRRNIPLKEGVLP